jgi:hypothetical protein
MESTIGHHTCRDLGNFDEICASGGPLAYSEHDPETKKSPFLGSGYYFWDDNIEMAHFWGRSRCKNKYYIFEAELNCSEYVLLDLVGNRKHMKWLINAMEMLKSYNNNNPRWEIGKFIELLKRLSSENGIYKGMFPFQSVRAVDHYAKIKYKYNFSEDESRPDFIDLDPRLLICVIDKNENTIKNFKPIFPINKV